MIGDPTPIEKIRGKYDTDYHFTKGQKILLNNAPLYKSLENKDIQFISGIRYIANPVVKNGLVRIAPTKNLCNDYSCKYGYVEAADIKEVK